MCRNTRVMRAAAVWYNVVGGSETEKAPNWYDYAVYGAAASSACIDGAGFSDASESYGHTRRARSVGYIAVTV